MLLDSPCVIMDNINLLNFSNYPQEEPLANIKSAKKRAVQNEKCRLHNTSLRSKFRTYIKKVLVAIAGRDQSAANAAYKEALPVIDGMVNKGIIHKNKAARHKSRLNQKIKDLAQA